MKNRTHTFKRVCTKLFDVLTKDEIYASAAQLAYSLVLSLVPLVMFIITLAARMDLPVEEIYTYLSFFLPQKSYVILRGIINEVMQSSSLSIYTLIPTIYFISIATRGLIRVINRAFKTKEDRGFIHFWLLSFVFAVLLVATLILSLVVIVFGKLILVYIFKILHLQSILWLFNITRYILSLILLGFILSLIYYTAPSLKLRFKEALVGGYSAGLLWTVGSMVFGFYINNFSNYGLLFGSLGGIFMLFGWMYWTSLVLLFGGYVISSLYYVHLQDRGIEDTTNLKRKIYR